MDSEQIISILKIAWPLIAIQLGLQIYATIDVIKRKKTKNLSPAIWVIIIILGEIIGAIVYLLFGRTED
ncbi:MAG TPA: PLDc N-terminal domain-containing protein [bacterium]|nr:PLDc N-terminal domain-containing protein [bacterium]